MAQPDLFNIVSLVIGILIGIFGADIRGLFLRITGRFRGNYLDSLKTYLSHLERLENNPSAMVATCSFLATIAIASLMLAGGIFALIGWNDLGDLHLGGLLALFGLLALIISVANIAALYDYAHIEKTKAKYEAAIMKRIRTS